MPAVTVLQLQRPFGGPACTMRMPARRMRGFERRVARLHRQRPSRYARRSPQAMLAYRSRLVPDRALSSPPPAGPGAVPAARQAVLSLLARHRPSILAGVLLASLAGAAVSMPGVDRAPPPVAPSAPAPSAVPANGNPEGVQPRTDNRVFLARLDIQEDVRSAIQHATRVVGVEGEYLTAVAARESSFDPSRHARQTTAAGLYQFTADTWLRVVKVFGEKHGLGDYARQIVVGDDGAVSLPDRVARARLLELRNDPHLSALMAAELALDNKARLERVLGRPVSPAETYIAHLFGVSQAARVIDAAYSAPHTPGARLLPTAARTNPGVFRPAGHVATAGSIVGKIETYFERRQPRFASS